MRVWICGASLHALPCKPSVNTAGWIVEPLRAERNSASRVLAVLVVCKASWSREFNWIGLGTTYAHLLLLHFLWERWCVFIPDAHWTPVCSGALSSVELCIKGCVNQSFPHTPPAKEMPSDAIWVLPACVISVFLSLWSVCFSWLNTASLMQLETQRIHLCSTTLLTPEPSPFKARE